MNTSGVSHGETWLQQLPRGRTVVFTQAGGGVDTFVQTSPVLLTRPRPHNRDSAAFCHQGFLHCPAQRLRAWQRAVRGSGPFSTAKAPGGPLGSQRRSEGCTSRPRPVSRPAGEPRGCPAERWLKPAPRRGAFAAPRGYFSLTRPLRARLPAEVPLPAGWRRACRARWALTVPRAGGAGPRARGAGGARGDRPLTCPEEFPPPSDLAGHGRALGTASPPLPPRRRRGRTPVEGTLPCALPLPSPRSPPLAFSSGHWDWWINHDVAAVNAFMWSGLCHRLQA